MVVVVVGRAASKGDSPYAFIIMLTSEDDESRFRNASPFRRATTNTSRFGSVTARALSSAATVARRPRVRWWWWWWWRGWWWWRL